MPVALAIEDFLVEGKKAPIIDVRTPAEFEQGHIPGAYNIPLFTNEERVIVGTLYKKTGRQEAILKGLEIFGPKMVWFIEELKKITSQNTVCIHCWRGGMRSGSVAWLFELYGYQIFQLKKGYKSFRRLVLDECDQERKIVIVGGKTGSGKTLTLHELKKMHQQVIDLEGLANHKGSSFGAIGEEKAPTQEQFENLLGWELMNTRKNENLYLEDESRLIGHRMIPKKIYEQMRSAPVMYCDVDFEERARYITEHYGQYPKEELIAATERIQKKLDSRYAKDALRYMEEGNYLESFKICLKYYDKTYEFGLSKRETSSVTKIKVTKIDPEKTAAEILKIAR